MYVTNNDTAAPISVSPAPRFGERRGGAAAAGRLDEPDT
jgi:hypothetical protein